MTIAAVVQARMNSTRLPGKVLEDLAGKTVLQRVLERCQNIPLVDVVVCAIPDTPESEALAEIAKKSGAITHRGSEQDLLARYIGAREAVGADIILRVTSDCPLVDPDICNRTIDLLVNSGADYASNLTPRSFPQGLDCEAFLASTLDEAAQSELPLDHEHVTPWHRKAAHIHRVNLLSGNAELANSRWTLDYPEDLAFLRTVFEALPTDSPGGLAEVLSVLEANPDIAKINECRNEKEFVVSWRQNDASGHKDAGAVS